MTKNMIFLFLYAGLLTAQQLPTPTWPNVNYAGNNHTYHMMDIYLPDDNRKHYPAVVVIYGSAWTSNDEKLSDYQKEVFVMPLAKKGVMQGLIDD